MEKNKSSKTAEGVAMSRAIESRRPERDRVIYDPYAQIFLSKKSKKWINNPIRAFLFKFLGNMKFPGFRGSIISRVRFMNECIKETFPDNFTQLVLLGAGYDMSAYCFRDILKDARIFEVDHPDTQKNKLEQIKNKITDTPDNIVYVPVNFETDDLKESLISQGYSPSAQTLFICEGVTCYLEKNSVEQTLDFIVANSAKGSKLAFDFFPPDVIDGTSADRLGKALHDLVKGHGESFKFGVSANEIEDFLKDHHFAQIDHCSPSKIRDRYFHGNNINRKVSDLFNFVCATT